MADGRHRPGLAAVAKVVAVIAKNLFFTNVAASTHRGDNSAKLAGATSWWQPFALAEARGAAATTATGASVAGTTVGIEFTSGTVALEWLSEPLAADFTISGTITGNLWGLESTMNDNTAINLVVDKIDGATGAITQIAKSARVTELGTTNAVNIFTVAPTSTACKRGDRLRVRPFLDDAGAAMIVGTTTFSYNGPTAGAAGDSYVQFTEDLTFEVPGDPGISTSLSQTATGSTVFLNSSSQVAVAQSFVAAGPTLVQVSLSFSKVSSPVDNLIFELQSDSGGVPGVPSGTVVGAVATYSGASLALGNNSKLETVSIALTQGVTYWLVARRSGAVDTVNYYGVNTGSNVAWASLYIFNGTAWVPSTSPFVVSLAFINRAAVPTYYLTDTAETINPGSAVEKKALTARGSGSVTAVTNTAAGPTAPIQVTASGGGSAVEWYTPALEAVSFGGKAKFVLRGLEADAATNASLCAQVAVCAGDGSGAVVWGKANVEAKTTYGSAGELNTADTAYVAWVSGDDVAITAGQRLRFRIYVEDPADVPLVASKTVTVSYNGASAAAAGDTYVILPVAVVEQSTGPTTWTGVVAVQLTDSRVTTARYTAKTTTTLALANVRVVNAFRVVLAAAAVQLTNSRTTNAVRKVLAAAQVALTDTRVTAGRFTAKTGASVALADTVTTGAVRKAVATIAVALTNLRASAARITARSGTATAETVVATTNGTVTGGAVSHFGAAAVQLVDNRVTNGTRTTFGTAAVALADARTTGGRFTAKSGAAVALVDTVTALAVRRAVTAAAVQLVAARAVAARLTAKAVAARPETVTVATSGFSSVGAATHYGSAAVQLTNQRATAATLKTYGAVARNQTVGILTSATKRAVAAAAALTAVTVTTAGRRRTFAATATAETVRVDTGGFRVWGGTSGVQETVSIQTDGTSVTTGAADVLLQVAFNTSAGGSTPLTPGRIDRGSHGGISHGRGGRRIDRANQGRVGSASHGRIARTTRA